MSGLTERLSSATEDRSIFDLVAAYYHLPLLLLAVTFSLWIRTRGWRNFVRGDRVLFSGNDAWYHLRTVTYSVRNWPFTMPFDPWTHYPVGNASGQFGTLFDQLIATAALVVGLGSPTEHQIAMTHLFAPAVFGALALVPAYYFAKRISDRNGGLVAVLLLTLTTGQFLTRGVAGFSDHHIAEVFFLTLAVFGASVAFSVAEREKPVYELVTTRDWEALRRPVLWGAIAGLFVTLYIWTWPPGVFVVGIFGIFFAIAMSVKQVRGTSPDHLATPGIVMGLVIGVLTLATIEVVAVDAVALSLLQPGLGFALAAGCAFLAGLARVWEDTDLPEVAYPVGVLGIGLVVAGVAVLAVPDLFDYFVGQVLRIFGYDATAETRTVAEAQPIALDRASDFFMNSYGLAIYTALGGFAFMLYRVVVGEDSRADHIFLLVLSVFLLLATLTQRRFDYYFAIPVAVLNGYLATIVFRLVDVGEARESIEDVEAYQVLAVLAVLLFVVAPLALGPATAPAVAQQRANPGEVSQWTGSLEWMSENTPPIGAYGTGDGQSLEYYGTYDRVDDFAYEDGEYGTLAWWDYGHWITVLGERIPDANPFQQGAREAANFLLATDEGTANELMVSPDGEETRYVMIDWKMGDTSADLGRLVNRRITPKFSAPYSWETEVNRTRADDFQYVLNTNTQQTTAFTLHSQSYYESMRIRLYQFHGSAIEPKPVVVEYERRPTQGGGTALVVPQGQPAVRGFDNMSAAREYAAGNETARVGGLKGPFPTERVPALRHYRLVHASESSALNSGSFRTGLQVYGQAARISPTQLLYTPPQWVKTFERVPGATVEGTGPPNATVTASVRMQMGASNQSFTYRQQARTDGDGTFTMTLPYSTTGYDQYGLDAGYTNVSTRATGPFTFTTPPEPNDNGTVTRYVGTAHVPEGNVIGENESAVTVELEREVREPPQDNGTNATDGANGTNVTDSPEGANATDGGNGTATASGDNATQSVAPPLYAGRAT